MYLFIPAVQKICKIVHKQFQFYVSNHSNPLISDTYVHNTLGDPIGRCKLRSIFNYFIRKLRPEYTSIGILYECKLWPKYFYSYSMNIFTKLIFFFSFFRLKNVNIILKY